MRSMHAMRVGVAVFMGLAIGCGSGEVDLTGIYAVTYHTLGDADCQVEGATATDPPYFRLQRESLFGVEVFTYSTCDGATDETCADSGGVLFGLSFQQPVEDGWIGEVSASSGFGDPCLLTYSTSSALLQEDGTVRIVAKSYSEEVTVPEEQCGYELAEMKGSSMACSSHEVLVGRLAPP